MSSQGGQCPDCNNGSKAGTHTGLPHHTDRKKNRDASEG